MISLREFDPIMVSNRKIAKIETRIFLVRGERVMLDSDLAMCYGVTAKRLNEQVRRNLSRFPDEFAFRLTAEEFRNLRSQIATSSLHGGQLFEPAETPNKREIGFHVSEKPGRYRATRKRNIERRIDG
ncbi:MAG: ORF6N domain-containing protein [Chthoniobacterales bacterium]